MKTYFTNRSGGAGVYLFLYLCIALIFMLRLFTVIDVQLRAPFDLVFEAPNLSTIKLIKAGENPYSPDVYSKPPFILTLYPPFYHYIAAAFPIPDDNPFFFGRLVSLICMFLATLSLFFVNRRNRIRLLPFIAAGVFFSFHPVINNTAFLKNDPLALFFSAFAVVTVYRSHSKGGVILAALLCVCALASKQSYVAAGLTCAVYLLLSNRRLGATYLLFLALFSGIFILITLLAWGKGFWFSTVVALAQDMVRGHAFRLLRYMAGQPLAWFLTAMSLSSMVIAAKTMKSGVLKDSPYFLYVLASGIVLGATLGKQGASANYFNEFLLAQLIWLVYIFRDNDAEDFRKPLFYIITGAFVICSMIELRMANRSDFAFVDNKTLPGIKIYYQRMNRGIKSLGFKHPRILNPFSSMHAFSISDRIYLNDPFLYGLLWKKGILDITPMLESIRNGYFDIIMLPSDKLSEKKIKGPQRLIYNEIMRSYQPVMIGSGHRYYIPRK